MKEFWPTKMELKRTTMLTAAKQGFGMSATANDVDAAYAAATTNFSEAHQATQTAVSNLTTSNAAYAAALPAILQQQQQQNAVLNMLVQQAANVEIHLQ